MLYYYAHSGHKVGLDRVRRGAAVLKKLNSSGVEAQLLINDFRAGLVAKELGVKEYVTVETVQDIDAIAQFGDSIIIDSPEDDHGRLVKYCEDFKNVWRFEVGSDDVSIHGEILFKIECKDESCLNAVIIDDIYFEHKEKKEQTIFFLSDADYDKIILNNREFFQSINMELILGNYFFVKYEDDLAKLFSRLHEPEEYEELIRSSTNIITASSQTALEAKMSGANVIYINIFEDDLYPVDFLSQYGINVVNNFNTQDVVKYLNKEMKGTYYTIEHFNESRIKSIL
jgi:spore coat polysaccharide biosynthesis predicted glycosyltransferase SpsG